MSRLPGQDELATLIVGRRVVYRAEVGSTNDELKALADAGEPDGTLFLADYQVAGRGRFDRQWAAPPGTSLLLSLLFRCALPPERVSQLTMLCSLSVREAIAGCAPAGDGPQPTEWRPELKWPNDVLLNGRKVAGLLTEISFRGSALEYVVVGIGINVNLDPTALPPGLLTPATSLLAEGRQPVDRLALLLRLLEGVDRRYAALRAGHVFTSDWAAHLATLGRWVSVAEGQAIWEGVAEAVEDDGALRIRGREGTVRRVRAGDVSVRHAG